MLCRIDACRVTTQRIPRGGDKSRSDRSNKVVTKLQRGSSCWRADGLTEGSQKLPSDEWHSRSDSPARFADLFPGCVRTSSVLSSVCQVSLSLVCLGRKKIRLTNKRPGKWALLFLLSIAHVSSLPLSSISSARSVQYSALVHAYWYTLGITRA